MARELERRKREEEEWRAWLQVEPISGADARRQRLRDTAYKLARKHHFGDPDPAPSRQQLAQFFPEVSGAEYASVYFEFLDELDRLRTMCGEVADQFREGRISQLEALRQLKKSFPGFSTDTYESAFADGMFDTR
jgi:hypothetical protein